LRERIRLPKRCSRSIASQSLACEDVEVLLLPTRGVPFRAILMDVYIALTPTI
jgi:hypothetical protein